jgi:hypothetical protein
MSNVGVEALVERGRGGVEIINHFSITHISTRGSRRQRTLEKILNI